MFSIVSSDSASDNEGEDQVVDNEITSIKSAMQNNIIIDHIYKFLCLEDIKSCRLVNQKLNFVAEPVLRKRATVGLSHCLTDQDDPSYTPDEFKQVFSTSNCTLPFTSFDLYGNQWNFPEFNKFFEEHGKSLKELKVSEVLMRDKNGDLIKETDISQLIKLPSCLTKLELGCDNRYDEKTIFSINLENLMSIKYLKLMDCKLTIGSRSGKIKLKNIHMKNVELFRKGKKLADYFINEAIDFSKAENIHFMIWGEIPTKIIFDIAECREVEKLFLDGVEVRNWAVSKCKINKLQLAQISIVEEMKMEIKKLKFIGDDGTFIELMYLPITLKKLELKRAKWSELVMQVSCSGPLSLPNLKILKFDNLKNLDLLSHFSTCDLTDVVIANLGKEDGQGTLQTKWLPESLKKLAITGTENIVGTFCVETLIIDSCSLNRASKILKIIAPEILILIWKRNFETNDSIVQFLRLRSLPTFVGPFVWKELKYVMSYLKHFVNEKSEYYRFENGKGQSITSEEFRKLAGLGKIRWKYISGVL